MTATQRRLEAIVHGAVQGVGFRYHTRLHARRLGLTGYVCNRWDGTVEVVAEGSGEALLALLEFLHQGPAAAEVLRVETTWEAARGEYHDFGVGF
ncbi:MAG: acylphosphatase [Chloroflexi bacterium]|nr:acylphosphatase [Chloroflexota bacterium]